jgi:hypothetical protein
VVGTDYPVAYHVGCSGGNFENSSFWNDAFLGYGSKTDVPTSAKEAIGKLIERLAIVFFKVKGEM